MKDYNVISNSKKSTFMKPDFQKKLTSFQELLDNAMNSEDSVNKTNESAVHKSLFLHSKTSVLIESSLLF
ncbi:hypothetical protein KKA14_09080 [bacterium]|nr:hypothetical protein [bacterium]